MKTKDSLQHVLEVQRFHSYCCVCGARLDLNYSCCRTWAIGLGLCPEESRSTAELRLGLNLGVEF